MKRRLFLLPVLLLTAAFVVSSEDAPSESRQLVVRVTSADSDAQVAFSAAYLFADDQRELVVENAVTPLTTTAIATSFGGIFRSADGESELRVELVSRDGTVERHLASGEGTVVFVNETDGHRWISVPPAPDE